MRRPLLPLLLTLALLLALPAWAQTLTVAADTALTEAIDDMARAFQAGHPGVTVQLKLAASGALLDQLAQGAPLDLLVSADAETVARGIERRLLVAGSQRELVTHSMLLVVPLSRGAVVQKLTDLAQPEVLRIAIARAANAPGGRLAREAIDAERLWPVVQRKVVWLDDTRQVLAAVARGDVDAGFVFRADALVAAERVRVVQVATGVVPVPVRVTAAVAATSKQAALAREFVASLASDGARQTLVKRGFGTP